MARAVLSLFGMAIQCDHHTTCCPGAISTPVEPRTEPPAEAKPAPPAARAGKDEVRPAPTFLADFSSEPSLMTSAQPPQASLADFSGEPSVVEARTGDANLEPEPFDTRIDPRRIFYRGAPSRADVANGDRQLGRGHKGPAVSQVQRQLRALGANIAEDGKLGPNTQAAIYAFQKAHGLTEERGRVGKKTLAALDAEYNKVAQAGIGPFANPNMVPRPDMGPHSAPIMALDPPVRDAVREVAPKLDAQGQVALYGLLTSARFTSAPPPMQRAILGRLSAADDTASELGKAVLFADRGALHLLATPWRTLTAAEDA